MPPEFIHVFPVTPKAIQIDNNFKVLSMSSINTLILIRGNFGKISIINVKETNWTCFGNRPTKHD